MSTLDRSAAAAPAGRPDAAEEPARDWWSAVRGTVRESVGVAVLEARVAATRLGLVLAAATVGGLLVASVWLGLAGAAALAAIEAGARPVAALAVFSALNAVLLWPVAWAVRRLLGGIGFETTLGTLFPAEGQEPADGRESERA